MSEEGQVETSPVWCIAANIVHEHPFGQQREIRKGTKHFAPGAKVHCVQFHWDGVFTRVEVVGRHRKSKRFIKIWMQPAHLANWRVELVYHPIIIKFLTNYAQVATGNGSEIVYISWHGTSASKAKAEEIVNGWLPQTVGATSQPFTIRKRHVEESS